MTLPARPTVCESFKNAARLNRRDVLRVGSLTGMSLCLPGLLRSQAQARPRGTFGRAKSVIMLYLHGGHAQQETWDPKPEAPSPACGEFRAIDTSIPGVHVSEVLPRSARLLHKLTILRSLTHENANHVQASLPAMTGHVHPPAAQKRGDFPPSATDYPPVGAVLHSLRGGGELPAWVRVGPLMRRNNGTVLHGQLPGLLGAKHSPFIIDQDLLPADVEIKALSRDGEMPVLRMRGRRDLLQQINVQRRALDQSANAADFDTYQQQAFNLLCSAATAKAFELASEPAAVRERYGKTEFGQRCLLARRLAEAGVPMVNVQFCHTPRGSWDTHGQHFKQMKESLCPIFDQAFTALVLELEERGLLEQTLVLATAEFGRTPKVNNNAGRDHWPWVYSVAMAGGGTRPGVVYGSSDKLAAYPVSQPHDPRDLIATVYHLLGVPADTVVHDSLDRPHHLIIGQKIDGLLL
ncbi:MAG: DUF1501 domain-containing protein [Gemmataceae bacterium]